MITQEEVEKARARLVQGSKGVRRSVEGTNDWLDDIAETLTNSTKLLNEAIQANPETRAAYIPILEQLLQLSLRIITMRFDVTSGQPPQGPVDNDSGRGEDDDMDARITALEKDVAAIKTDVAVIRSNYSTGKDVAEAKSSIILWVVGAIFIAQILPAVKDWLKPSSPSTPSTASAPAQAPAATALPPAKQSN